MSDNEGARLVRIAVYPIKSLDPVECERATIGANGGLAHDREYTIKDEDGHYVNGKRTADVHRIRSIFTDGINRVKLRLESESNTIASRFDLEADRESLEDWLSNYFGYPVKLERDREGGFPDDVTRSGPTLISTATLREVASWFDGLDEHQIRLRMRANLEIDGVPPFWEDHLFSDSDHEVAFRIGDVTLRGVKPCVRCIVPTRDPHTGDAYSDFQRIFIENRERTLPGWVDRSRFDHYFRLMVNTNIPAEESNSALAIGDAVEIIGERPVID